MAVYPVIIAFGSERMSAQILADARPAVIDIFEDQEVPYTAQLIGQIVDTTMLMDALGSGTWDVSLIPASVPIRYADDIRSITVLPSQQNPRCGYICIPAGVGGPACACFTQFLHF